MKAATRAPVTATVALCENAMENSVPKTSIAGVPGRIFQQDVEGREGQAVEGRGAWDAYMGKAGPSLIDNDREPSGVDDLYLSRHHTLTKRTRSPIEKRLWGGLSVSKALMRVFPMILQPPGESKV